MAEIRFDGRVAIVTGAGGGLGREHALLLAARGAKVVVNDLGGALDGTGGSASPAEAVAEEIERLGGVAVADGHSVATPEGGQAIVDAAVGAFGRVDVVVNNAGILRDKTLQNMTPELLDPVLDVHLRGAFNVTRPAWPCCASSATAGCSSPPPTPASSATSASRTTARPRWAWSGWPGCSPRRAPGTTSTSTRSPRSPAPA
jgi:NAD(P)-dependent dehydrogenase (short-subunit alcohol dehydrogenase family)